MVWVMASGYASEWYNGVRDWRKATAVTVIASQTTTGNDFTLDQGASISGRITQADGSTPVSGAIIVVYLYNSLQGMWVDYCWGSSASDGSYTTPGLAAGQYGIRVTKSGYASKWFSNTYDSHQASPVTITPPTPASNINVSLSPGGTISGNVSGATGPIVNAVIYIFDVNLMARGSYSLAGFARTDPNGNFTSEGLPAGQYAVRAHANGYASKYYNNTYLMQQLTPVAVTVSSNTPGVNFTLAQGASVSGHVYQQNGTTPVMNSLIYVLDYNQMITAQEGSKPPVVTVVYSYDDGSFTTAGLPAGTYAVYATEAGYASQFYNNKYNAYQANQVSITPPTPALNVDFSLQAGGYISGRVTDGTNPLGNVNVSFLEFASLTGQQALDQTISTDSNGNYTSYGLLPGQYGVKYVASGYSTQWYNNKSSAINADPVVVTVGNNTINIDANLGSSGSLQKLIGANDTTATGNDDPNYFLLDRFTAEANGTLSQIKIKCGAAGNVKVAIYNDSSGNPGSLRSSLNTSTLVVSGWNQINITPTAVVSGTPYWLALISDSRCVSYKSTGGTGRYMAASYSGFTFPTTPSGLSSWTGYHFIQGWSTGGGSSPTIGFSPSSFTFNATQGGSNPANQTLNIYNSGSGALSWSLSDDASWLTLSPTSGTDTGSPSLSVNISGMSAATYNGTITITATGATNTPQTVPVTLTIAPSGGTSKLVGANDTTATGNDDPNYFLLDRFTAEANGTLSQIQVKCGASGNVKVAIYSDSYGSPGSLLGSVNTGTPVTAGWNQISITPTTIVSGTPYWLAFISDTNCVGYKWTNVNDGTGLYKAASYSGFNFTGNPTGLTSWPAYHLIRGWGTP
jgi:hypothetical protein